MVLDEDLSMEKIPLEENSWNAIYANSCKGQA